LAKSDGIDITVQAASCFALAIRDVLTSPQFSFSKIVEIVLVAAPEEDFALISNLGTDWLPSAGIVSNRCQKTVLSTKKGV
jgi:hypothetical protein